MTTEKNQRDGFSSNFGIIAAAAGAAIGLGNIWKFPYIAGENGGGAFLFIYLAFIAIIGGPVMVAEFMIGRKAKLNVIGAFRVLAPKEGWAAIGIMGFLAAFFILSFYGTVAGWTLEYLFQATINGFDGKSPEDLKSMFSTFSTSTVQPVFYQLIFMFLTAIIVVGGVQKGIEKYTKLLMPLLIVIILVLDIRAVTLKGSVDGLKFLFSPDFSKVNAKCIMDALGHAFFSLSLGMGTLLTYASYFRNDTNLSKTAAAVSISDTLIAILSGVAIFPAVFAFSIEPDAGPGLVFITLPNVFEQMPGGYIFAILFFLLLAVAALTSSISILEVVVAFVVEEFHIARKKSVILSTVAISISGIFCTLSLGILDEYTLFGKNYFDLLDYIASNMLLPLGGMLISLFIGWRMQSRTVLEELFNRKFDEELTTQEIMQQLTAEHGYRMYTYKFFMIITRFVAPIAIFAVFLHGIGLF